MNKTKDIKENMKKDTKENSKKEIKKETKEKIKEDIKIDEILQFESLTDAQKFEEFAKGRMFCKKGERLQDICEDEMENYICRTSRHLILKWYFHKKTKKNKGKMLLESRLISVTRSLAIDVLNKEEDIDEKELVSKVRENILNRVKKYKKELSQITA